MEPKPVERYLLNVYGSVGGRGLDYGCGDGRLVVAARDQGHEFEGVEAYYGSEDFEQVSAQRTPEAARGHIHLLDDQGRIPFPDASFDFVCSNQVLEHVEDLPFTVSELARVTRPGGSGLHLFPTREILSEPHLGVPFYHRLPDAWRRIWAWPWHRAGRANFSRDDPDYDHWYTTLTDFYNTSVYLRPLSEVLDTLCDRFVVEPRETEKLAFHTGRSIPPWPLLRAVEHRRVGIAVFLRPR